MKMVPCGGLLVNPLQRESLYLFICFSFLPITYIASALRRYQILNCIYLEELSEAGEKTLLCVCFYSIRKTHIFIYTSMKHYAVH